MILKNIDKSKWNIVNFGEVVAQVKDKVDRKKTGLIYYLGGEHFNNGDIHIRRKGIIKNNPIGPAFHMRFKPGNVLLVSRNPHLRKASLSDFEGICANTTYVCKAIREKVLPEILPFIMQSDAFWHSAEMNKRGSTNPYLNWKDFAKFKFKLSPLDEQKNLADLLWSIDNVVESYNYLLNMLERMKLSVLKGSYYDLKEEKKSISYIAEINPKIDRKNIEKNKLVSFIKMANISKEGYIINKENRKYSEVEKGFSPFMDGDILFAKITPCMENGKGALCSNLMNGIGFGSTEYHVIRPKHPNDRLYLLYLTRMFHFRKRAERFMTGTAGQKRVPSDFFDDYKVCFPKREKRTKLGEELKKIDDERKKITNIIITAKDIQKQIINKIFG